MHGTLTSVFTEQSARLTSVYKEQSARKFRLKLQQFAKMNYNWIVLVGCLVAMLGCGEFKTTPTPKTTTPTPTTNTPTQLGDLQRECPDGFFGYKCRFKCHCRDSENCTADSGNCPSGCADGYFGPRCQLTNNCYYNGESINYMGSKSMTENLYNCQRWDVQFPHQHDYSPEDFVERRFTLNYCRPTLDWHDPWCYTTDINVRWQSCGINNCTCPPGRFGSNCAEECHCRNNTASCESITGSCQSGCAAGWNNSDCQKEFVVENAKSFTENEPVSVIIYQLISRDSEPMDTSTLSSVKVKSLIHCGRVCLKTDGCRSFAIDVDGSRTCSMFNFVSLDGLRLAVNHNYYALVRYQSELK